METGHNPYFKGFKLAFDHDLDLGIFMGLKKQTPKIGNLT